MNYTNYGCGYVEGPVQYESRSPRGNTEAAIFICHGFKNSQLSLCATANPVLYLPVRNNGCASDRPSVFGDDLCP
jgi:hypothetical protein